LKELKDKEKKKRDKLQFTSTFDYNQFILDNSELFKDFRQTFDLIYMIDLALKQCYPKHKEYKGYFSIVWNYFKSKSRNLKSFNKIESFDILFDSVKDIKVSNAHTELTYAYKLKYRYISQLLSYGKTKPKTYIRDKFNIKIQYKGKSGKLYKTKKDLMQGENLGRRTVDKNISQYAYEIKELAKGTPMTQSVRPNKSYSHMFSVNIEKCKEILDDVNNSFAKNEEPSVSQYDFIGIHNYITNYERNIPCYLSYERKNGGRLVNFGGSDTHIQFQSLEKSVREKVFEGFYEIDIENSAPTILLQSAKKYTKLELNKIEYYVNNKQKCRESLMDLGLTYKESKELHIAIFFGASLELHGTYNKNVWAYKFGIDKIEYILTNSDYFRELYEEVRLLFYYLGKAIKNKFYTTDKKGRKVLYNSRGNKSAKYMDRWDNKKGLMHYYFGIESQILDLIINNYKHDLLLYDAFITKEDVDIEELSLLIENELGYKVKFSKRLIGNNNGK